VFESGQSSIEVLGNFPSLSPSLHSLPFPLIPLPSLCPLPPVPSLFSLHSSILLADLLRISEVSSWQRLRSATTSALVGRCTQRSTIGDRAFAAAAPAVWNSLPEEARSSTSLQLFRHQLKSELFRRSLGPRHST